MSFNGIAMGMLVGLGLMYFWMRLIRHKRKVRLQLAEDNATLLAAGKAAAFESLTGIVPKWVNFSEFEDADWMNRILDEMWPFIEKAVEDVVREIVEPVLEESKPPGVSSMVFSRVDLGSNSPQITGVRVQSHKANQAVLDIRISWQGNCKIKLKILTAALAKVVPCIEDLSFDGTLRIILEFTDKIPVVAAYVAAISRRPTPPHYDLDFRLEGAGLSAIPGLRGWIHDMIVGSVDNMLQWPKRIMGAVAENYDTKHLEFQYDGVVVVTVLHADGLENTDTFDKSDPRVVLWVEKTHKAATNVVMNNLNPRWTDEVFELPVDDVHSATLYFEVQDKDPTGWETMGYATLPLEDVLKQGKETSWSLEIVNSLESAKQVAKNRGTLTFSAVYRNLEGEEREEMTKREEERVKKEGPKKMKEALGKDEAAVAKAKALASAQDREQNKAVFKGVGMAAKKLIQLQKMGPLSSSSSSSFQAPAPGAAASPSDSASAPSPGSASASGAAVFAQDPASASAGAREAGSAAQAEAAAFDAPAAAAAAAAGSAAAFAAQALASSADVAGHPPASNGAEATTAGTDASSSATSAVPPVVESGSGGDDDGSSKGKRHKVSNFFKGVGHTLTHALKHEGSDVSLEGALSGDTSPSPSPSPAATPGHSRKHSGILAAFKKDKKAAE